MNRMRYAGSPRGGGGSKGGNFPRVSGLRGLPKGNIREWKGPPKTPKRVFCPGSQKSSGRPWRYDKHWSIIRQDQNNDINIACMGRKEITGPFFQLESLGLIGMQQRLFYNFPRKGIRSKHRRSPCIFQVVVSLYQYETFLLIGTIYLHWRRPFLVFNAYTVVPQKRQE
jgi:hypothetical protein